MKPEDDLDKQSTGASEPARVFTSDEKAQVRRGSITPRQRNFLIVFSSLAVLVILVIVVVVWRRRSAAPADETTTPVVSVKVAKADKDAIAAQIVAVGTIWPREKSDVGVKISAQIKNMALVKNKLVRAGEVLAVLESRDLQAQRAEAVAALNQARAEERSVATGTIPKTNAEDQKALMDARAKVNNARALYDRRRALYEK